MDRRMAEYEAKKQTPLVAYILLVVFGVVGAHNFYLGRRGQALAQRVARGRNPNRKSSNYIQGCTICVSCLSSGPCWTEPLERENRGWMAGLPRPLRLFAEGS
ncbi:TM2 domain-containing protein [Candidatus Palauibacter polyketidifaciens]|uniref:TM2 domain-containing protein n=1 Tax=Candidatus Palauibacter polyketidifaciens TaxID=3056740 RepID=UPI002396AD49|nr:TM2 domain-containing protein [Candidatus Palauibacter polyketidifaciens]MDE2720045.1 TM2 domain-containing protein [Candidatus Palauibacter polyketidifaciens]